MHQGVQNSLNSLNWRPALSGHTRPVLLSGAPSTHAEAEAGPRLVRRERNPEGTRVGVGHVEVGGRGFVVMAGPCAVEGSEQTQLAALAVASAGAQVLRGGAFK